MLTVKVKLVKVHPDAKLPFRKHTDREVSKEDIELNHLYQPGNIALGTGDTGYDLTCVENVSIAPKSAGIVDTGLKLSYIEPGYWFMIAPRSGLGFKSGIQPHLGTIDNPYRGDLRVKLYNFSDVHFYASKGDRIAQLIFYPVISADFNWTDSITNETSRGEGGFGSTGT